MAGPKSNNAIAKTISLPDELWQSVEVQSDEWHSTVSATIRRMILEWLERNTQPCNQENETEPIAA